MANRKTLVVKQNDRDVVRVFKQAARKFETNAVFTDATGSLTEADADEIAAINGRHLDRATLKAEGFKWTWHRTRDDPHRDALVVEWTDGTQPDRTSLATMGAFLEKGLLHPLATAAKTAGAPELGDLGDMLTAMESVAAKLITDTADYRRSLDEEVAKKEAKLLARVDEQSERELARIDKERERISGEQDQRASDLDKRSAELDQRQKAIDDRNNTHVRREIRNSLLDLTKERLSNFVLSNATRRQYFLVNVAVIVGLFALVTGSILCGTAAVAAQGKFEAKRAEAAKVDEIKRGISESTRNPLPAASWDTATVAFTLKSTLLAITAVWLGYWYLGWLNRWLQRIADAEFRLQEFRLDIERASWLAETVLEWKATSPDPFPELLASRLSAGLFESPSSSSHDPRTPAAELAEAIMGAAASAKIKINDQEIMLDRKSLRNLQREQPV